MKNIFFSAACLLLIGCSISGEHTNGVSSASDSNSALSVEPITSTSDSMTWRVGASSILGLAIDYPEHTWDSYEQMARMESVSAHEINLLSPDNQKFSKYKIGQVMPYKATGLVLSVNSWPEFLIYEDSVQNVAQASNLLRQRFGANCRIQLSQDKGTRQYLDVLWGTGEDLMTRTCLIPNVSVYIFFDSSRDKLITMFMNQEERFLSKDVVKPPSTRAYDGFIVSSLRLIP